MSNSGPKRKAIELANQVVTTFSSPLFYLYKSAKDNYGPLDTAFREGTTALYRATSERNHTLMRRLLTEAKADPKQKNDRGHCDFLPIEAAVCGGDLEAVKLLIDDSGVNPQVLFEMAFHATQWDLAQYFVNNYEIDIHQFREKNYPPPLHQLMIGERHYEMAKCLLDKGADPNATDCEGRTPLDIFIFHCLGALPGYPTDKQLWNLLLDKTADLNKKQGGMTYALKIVEGAASYNCEKVIEMLRDLVKKEAILILTGINSYSLLHYSVAKGDATFPLTRFLVEELEMDMNEHRCYELKDGEIIYSEASLRYPSERPLDVLIKAEAQTSAVRYSRTREFLEDKGAQPTTYEPGIKLCVEGVPPRKRLRS